MRRCWRRAKAPRAARPLQGLRIGLPSEFFPAALAADVNGAVRAALAEFEKLGATLVDVSLPRTELSIPVYYIIAPAEASSNLSRFDGVKFGHRAKDYSDLRSMYERSRAEGFGPEVKRRIMIGTYVLSHGYYDAYYLQAQKLRRMIADDFQACFQACDLIAGPVAPTVAWKIGEQSDDPVKAYLADIFTLPASLAGLPGMSVPAGFGEARHAGGPAADRQLLRRRPAAARRACLPAGHRLPHPRAGRRERRMSAPPLIRGFEVVIGLETHAQLSTRSKIFSGASTAVRRRAQHPGLRGGPGAAGHAAGAEPRRGRARHPLRPGGGRQGGAAVDLRAQELLLPRPAQGLPDQPVRDPGGAGRPCRHPRRRAGQARAPDARAPRRRRRQDRCTRTTPARPAST